MAALSKRLAALESLYGPPIVEAEPPTELETGIMRWGPEDQLILSQHARDRVNQLRNMLDAEPRNDRWRVEIAELKAGAPDRCNGCEAWPMTSIRFDPDGAVRCGGCQILHEWLPPRSCGYFGHPAACACDYDPVGDLQWRWFWPVITDECQQILLEWYGGEGTAA